MSFDESLDADFEAATESQNPFPVVEMWMRVHGMTLPEIKHAETTDHFFSVYGKDKKRPMFTIPFQTAAEATRAHAILIGEMADLRRTLKRELIVL